jgi:hypothetical protein
MDRRTFIKSVAGYGLAAAGPVSTVVARDVAAPSGFGLHPFIEAHPEAVFIRKTNVPVRSDAEAKRKETFAFVKQILTLRDSGGAPLTSKIAIKPNLTSAKNTGLTYGIVTDPFVVEGFVDGFEGIGLKTDQIYIREGLMVEQRGTGFIELAQRRGLHYGDQDSRTPTMKECPDGVVFRRTKYLGPFNHPDSWLLNVAKFKTHSMGLTLCVKNLQGTNVPPYIRFCGGVQPALAQDFQPDAQSHVEELYEKHKKAGLSRWETERGAWMEMWIQRTLDHYPLIHPTVGLNVIEGVYAQDGDAFDGGPGPDGTPNIFPSNLLVFGKDAFRVDIIGHWLGGHEPGNFGLFHIARERGVSNALNPANVPVYVWEDSGPKLTTLDHLPRTPLLTPYLGRSGEAKYHMCNEPVSYPGEKVAACLSGGDSPEVQILGKKILGAAASSLVLQYNLPQDGHVSLEVLDRFGDRVAVPARGWTTRGIHAAEWNLRGKPSDRYRFRLRVAGHERVGDIKLV